MDEQEADCRAVCERAGWQVVRVFTDNDRGASRHSRKQRPEYTALRQFLTDGGADVLVMWEGSRAQRDITAYASLRDLCAERKIGYSYSGRLYDLTRTDDRFSTGLDALLAEREADVTRDRVLRAVRANAASGRPHGKLLYGYRRVYDDRGRFLEQVEHPEQAEVVREAARRVRSGEALYSIAQDFQSRGIPTPRAGKGWRPEQIPRLVTNPGYVGRRVHKGKVVGDAVWPAILDENVYADCVARLSDPARRTHRDNRARHLLTGVTRCAHCDGRMFVQKAPRQQKGTVLTCRTNFCAAAKEQPVEDFVVELLISRLSRPDFLDLYAAPGQDDAAAARAEAAELRGRLEGFYAAAAEGKVSPEGLAAIEARLRPQIEDADRRAVSVSIPAVLQVAAGPRARETWAGFSLDQQRQILRLMVEIRISRAGRGTRYFSPLRLRKSRWSGDERTWGEIWAADEDLT